MDNQVLGIPNLLKRCSGPWCFSKSIFLEAAWEFELPLQCFSCAVLLSAWVHPFRWGLWSMGCPSWMQHFFCVTATVWITRISKWRATLLKATVHSGVTLTCISSSTEQPEMTSVLQSLTYFKARLILSKQQLHLRQRDRSKSFWNLSPVSQSQARVPCRIQSCSTLAATLLSAPWLSLHVLPKHML